MQWSGLVSLVGALHRVNFIAPVPPWTDLPKKKNVYEYEVEVENRTRVRGTG